MNTENKKPNKVIKAGLISLSLWEKEIEGKKIQTLSFQKAYKDKKEDSWKYTQTFNKNDLPKLRLLIDEAYKELTLSEE